MSRWTRDERGALVRDDGWTIYPIAGGEFRARRPNDPGCSTGNWESAEDAARCIDLATLRRGEQSEMFARIGEDRP